MRDETQLDAAHAAMAAAPEDAAARLGFYARLADGELYLMLEREAGATIEPRLFELAEGPVVLAFDREDRLAEFAGGPVPYAALPGRALVELLAGQGIGLGVNLEVAPSATLLPAEAVDWLGQMLGQAPEAAEDLPRELLPPRPSPALIAALERGLAKAVGLAEAAWLAEARYAGARRGLLLALVGAAPGAEAALGRAAAEALAFSGLDAGGDAGVDLVFLAAADPAVARLQRVGLGFDLRPPAAPAPAPEPARRGPGTDPDKPPLLR